MFGNRNARWWCAFLRIQHSLAVLKKLFRWWHSILRIPKIQAKNGGETGKRSGIVGESLHREPQICSREAPIVNLCKNFGNVLKVKEFR